MLDLGGAYLSIEELVGTVGLTPIAQIVAGLLKGDAATQLISLDLHIDGLEGPLMFDGRQQIVDLLRITKNNSGRARNSLEILKHLLQPQNQLRDRFIGLKAKVIEFAQKQGGRGWSRERVAVVEKVVRSVAIPFWSASNILRCHRRPRNGILKNLID